jgi:hypothetical protein
MKVRWQRANVERSAVVKRLTRGGDVASRSEFESLNARVGVIS